MPDVGWTHIALPVTDMDRSLEFYDRYAEMGVVHLRSQESESNRQVAWLSDGTRPFVLVLVEVEQVKNPLGEFAHLGVACSSREEVDRRVALARSEGIPVEGPQEMGPPVGYWVFLRDPDGHTLELSFGQEVDATLDEASGP